MYTIDGFSNVFQQNLRRRDRIFRDMTNPFDIYDDTDLIKRYRMPRKSIIGLVDALHDDLEPPTSRCHSIPATLQVLTALRYYATGSFQQVIADVAGLTQPSVSRIISRTSTALSRRVGMYIQFPTNLLSSYQLSKDFHKKSTCQTPLVVSTGHSFQLSLTVDHEEAYVCRKAFHALNVQGV